MGGDTSTTGIGANSINLSGSGNTLLPNGNDIVRSFHNTTKTVFVASGAHAVLQGNGNDDAYAGPGNVAISAKLGVGGTDHHLSDGTQVTFTGVAMIHMSDFA